MIEVRTLPQLEVADWSHIVRVPLGGARGGRSPTVLFAALLVTTAILSAILVLG
jgi:hypothetical protein